MNSGYINPKSFITGYAPCGTVFEEDWYVGSSDLRHDCLCHSFNYVLDGKPYD